MAKTDRRSLRAQALREERKAQLLDAALQVFSDQGFHKTSITDIVKAAGVARGTFYLYFDSKDVLFLELLDRLMLQFRSSIVGVDTSANAPDFATQLISTISGILETAASAKSVAKILFREAVGLGTEMDQRISTFEQMLHDYLVHSLKNGIDMGWVRTHDPEIVAHCIYGAMRQLVYFDSVSEKSTLSSSPEAVATEVVQLYLLGLLPIRG